MSAPLEILCLVLICDDTEWKVIRSVYPEAERQPSPFGEWFVTRLSAGGRDEPVWFFHGGWGKIAAAASTQYAIDRWHPRTLINLGTCGGFEGEIERGDIVLADRTVVYDIVESIGDAEAVLAHFATDLDLSWLAEPYPDDVRRTLLVSGDRDLLAEDIPHLKAKYGAVAADWESGTIAWVAARNGVRCLILRGVSDLVGSGGGEAYGHFEVFAAGTERVMRRLVEALPAWIARAEAK